MAESTEHEDPEPSLVTPPENPQDQPSTTGLVADDDSAVVDEDTQD